MTKKTKTKTKKAPKPLTLHQRMRIDAAKKLDGMLERATDQVAGVVSGTSVTTLELMNLAGGTQTKVLRERLIKIMTSHAEAEMMRAYESHQETHAVDGS